MGKEWNIYPFEKCPNCYTLPAELTRKVGIEKVRAYVSGSNLFTLTGVKYFDPEMPNVNQGYYPQQRVYEFGLNITF